MPDQGACVAMCLLQRLVMRRVIPTVQVTSAGRRNQGGFPRFAQFQDAEVNRKKNCHNILSINIPTLTKKNAVTTSKEPGKFSKDRLKDHLANQHSMRSCTQGFERVEKEAFEVKRSRGRLYKCRDIML